MKRDCGEGELIVVRYELKWCVGQADKEKKKDISSYLSKDYEAILETLPPYSNIRMYALDKVGYANCIRSSYVRADGTIDEDTNRFSEL